MLPNLEIQNIQNSLNAQLQNLSQILFNSSVLLYQNIPQNTYINLQYATAKVNYNYVPSYFQFVNFISFSQIGDIIQNYTNACNVVIEFIYTNNLANFLQNKINIINQSISTLNNFAVNLYNNEQASIFTYTIPYPMSIRTAMFLNSVDFSNLDLVLLYNLGGIQNVQLLLQNSQLILFRST